MKFICYYILSLNLQNIKILLMAYIKTLVFLFIIKTVVCSHNKTTNHKKMHLNKTHQNTLAVLSHDQVIVGY